MRSPPTWTSPEVGPSRPPTRLRSVVLPEPEGPISATKSPFGMSSVRPCSTSTVCLPRTYDLWTSRTRTIASLIAALPRFHRVSVLQGCRRLYDHEVSCRDAGADLAAVSHLAAERNRAALRAPLAREVDDVLAAILPNRCGRDQHAARRRRRVASSRPRLEERDAHPHLRHDARVLHADRDAHFDRRLGAVGG